MLCNYKNNKIEQNKIAESIQSLVAHLEHGDSWRLQRKIFKDFHLCRIYNYEKSGGA